MAARNSGSYSAADIIDGDFDGQNQYTHPVVITHPETGRRALFVNPGFSSHLKGLTDSESRSILNALYQHSVSPEHVYRHAWKPNDLVIWDNRCTMHFAIQDYSADRYLHRSTVVAAQPQR